MRYFYALLLSSLLSGFQKPAHADLSRDWVTYFGTGNTKIHAIEFDTASKYIYITGTTTEPDLGTPGVHQQYYDQSIVSPLDKLDIFLAKFTTEGGLVWFTYYGGDKSDMTPGIAIDKNGDIYLSGFSLSKTGIASPNAFKTTVDSGGDFIAKFTPNGQRIWSSYYAERSSVWLNGPKLAIDQHNNVYMSHITDSINGLATPGSFMTSGTVLNTGSGRNAYLVKFDPQGQRLWATYFGGGGEIWTEDLKTDVNNNIYLAAYTSSRDNISSPGAMYPNMDAATLDVGFIVKFSSTGQRMWSTYVHDKEETRAKSLAIDHSENVYIYGFSRWDSGIATPGTHKPHLDAMDDHFIMKLNSGGQKVWGTYYGGSGEENDLIVVNPAFDLHLSKNSIRLKGINDPDIYICGYTNSLNDIQLGCTYPSVAKHGFLSKFSGNGQLLWGSYYDAPVFDIALGELNSIYAITNTELNDLATPGAHSEIKPATAEAGLVAKFLEAYVCPDSDTISFSRINDSLVADLGYVNYKWFKNDTLVQNGGSHIYLLQNQYEGIYKVEVNTDCNCDHTSDTSLVQQGTGVNGHSRADFRLRLHPNPAKDHIMLETTLPDMKELHFTIIDQLGAERINGKLPVAAQRSDIDVSALSPGVYFIRISDGVQWDHLKFVKE